MIARWLFGIFVALIAVSSQAQTAGVVGDWREPGGSVIRIAPCGQDLCFRLEHLGGEADSSLDTQNPAPEKRSQHLCGLQIGYGFHPGDPTHADGGRLYDPKSGKTYRGEMTSSGDTLHLRGYVGIRAFGRTEDWTRVNGFNGSCP